MRTDLPPANSVLAASIARWNEASIMAGGAGRRRPPGAWERAIHHGGSAVTKTLHRDMAAALCADLHGHAPQQILQAVDHAGVIVAHLEQHFRSSRDDARRAGIEGDAAGGPYRARSAEPGKPVVDINAKPDQRQAGVLATVHPGGAGMVLLTGKCDPVLPDADDGGDDADRETAALQRLALLDMRLEISDMPAAFGLRARAAGQPDV